MGYRYFPTVEVQGINARDMSCFHASYMMKMTSLTYYYFLLVQNNILSVQENVFYMALNEHKANRRRPNGVPILGCIL
jgi:hypothetical protein